MNRNQTLTYKIKERNIVNDTAIFWSLNLVYEHFHSLEASHDPLPSAYIRIQSLNFLCGLTFAVKFLRYETYG